MLSQFAPYYADITMAYWEAQNLPKCRIKPKIYLKYLDDIFMIWEYQIEDFNDFFHLGCLVVTRCSPDIQSPDGELKI